MSIYNARDLAIAWLSVSTAAGTDKKLPSMHRSVLIEEFPFGVRLIATDGFTLLTSWCPDLEHENYPEPELDAAPLVTAVALDLDGRARSLMAHALKLADRATADELPPVEVRLRLGIIDLLSVEDRPTLDGLEPEVVTIEVPDQEQLRLRTYDGEFPTWRFIVTGWSSFPDDRLAVPGDRFALLGRLAKLHAGPIALTFGGPARPVRIETLESWPIVTGLVMPARWDFDRDEPWEPSDEEIADAIDEWSEDDEDGGADG